MKYLSYLLFFLLIIACSHKPEAKTTAQESMYIPDISLLPFVNQNGNSIMFELKAVRNNLIENEYFPNSENLRIELCDSTDSIIWTSNYKKVFMMAIESVLPKDKGEEYTYSYEWDMILNDDSRLQPGKYKAIFTLPAKPKNYYVSLDFERK